MAHVWFKDTNGSWGVQHLEGPRAAIRFGSEGEVRVTGVSQSQEVFSKPTPLAVILRYTNGRQGRGSDRYGLVLTSPLALWVNGARLIGGLRILEDRDELRMGVSAPFYFSTEELAKVVAFPGLDRAAICPRCMRPIEPGQLSVKCPNYRCGVWHHQIAPEDPNEGEESSPCWTYGPHCAAGCGRETDLAQQAYAWTPEEL